MRWLVDGNNIDRCVERGVLSWIAVIIYTPTMLIFGKVELNLLQPVTD
jgi:hypothetical protein